MKTLELQPTEANVLKSFEDDYLGRNIDVMRFAGILNTIESSCSIALDARWGEGKTFFIKQIKMVLDAFNDHIEKQKTDNSDAVKLVWNRIRVQNKPDIQPMVSVYYDAWINDNDEDPIMSLVYSILQSVSSDFVFSKKPDFLSCAAGIMEAVHGRSLLAVREALKSENPMSSIQANKDIQTQVSEFLQSLLPERGNRLIIFVDELDRCNPAFAVRLLERIKHYFGDERITFVFSVNISELQHTVRAHYGESFDASRYLDRFFDLRLDLPPARLDVIYQDIGLGDDRYVYESVCKAVVQENHLSLRETLKFYRMAKAAAYKPMHDSRQYSFMFSEGKTTQFCLMFLVPTMIGLKICNYERYDAFIKGQDSTPLREILLNYEMGRSLCNDLLAENETYDDNGGAYKEDVVKLSDKIEELYRALFVHRYSRRSREITIGKLSFGSDTQTELFRAVSALSNYADFDV